MKGDMIEIPVRCDHPFDEITLLCTNTNSLIPDNNSFSAIIYCNKCKSYILLKNKDWNDRWNEKLYLKLIRNKNILSENEFNYFDSTPTPNMDQMQFYHIINYILNKKEKDLHVKILDWMWENYPNEMSCFVNMVIQSGSRIFSKSQMKVK